MKGRFFKKSKVSQKKSKKNQSKKSLYSGIVVVVCLGLYLSAGWFMITKLYRPQSNTGVSLVSAQAVQNNNFHRSLDLRIAKKATYPSNSITSVKDLGTHGEIKRFIVSFQVEVDGLKEFGLMSLPSKQPPSGGYPVVLLLHAYSYPAEYHTETDYLSDMDFYAEKGFAVIKPDFRGQGLSAGAGQPEGSNYSMAYVTDLMSLISAVKKTGYLNPKAINLWGHSMGAGIALKTAILSRDIKSAILIAGPVADFRTMYEDYRAPSDVGNPIAAGIKDKTLIKYGTPEVNPNFWHYTSPINFLSSTSTYFQIHVGSADQVVPPRFSADLDMALTHLHKKHGYFVYPGGDHALGAFRSQIWRDSLPVLGVSS